ncbi:hypothetical protein P8C59_003136 [Phyllachora maydis]|uniref:Retrovirus-related Pol polyprotein from transposon TNT 1-94-like beta-barrel domain-containing protein n=1 Tax=Phyllachora maydis TaxID=1825666 RepID=A0AAD9I160_9PEZI|nr:hypothetical protein P8C59_003136 [Phyllachora maydis]
MLGLTASSLNIEYLIADILEESRNPAIEAYRAAHVANSSNSTPNSNSNPSKKGKNKKKGKKKASYNVEGQNYSAKSTEQASFMLGSYNLAIEEEEEFDSSSNSNHISNSKERFTTFTPNIGQLRLINTGNSPISLAGIGSITLEVLSRKAPPTYTKLVLDNVLYLPNININIISRVRHYNSGGCLIKETLYRGNRRYIARNKIVVEIPSNSIRKEDYRPIIEDTIVSEAIEPNKRYKLRNSPAKGTTLEVIEGNEVEKAISSPTLKEPNKGQRDYYNLLNLAKLWHVRLGHIGLYLLKKTSSITKGLPNFDKIKEADFHCSSYDRGKVVRRVSKALIPNLPRVLDSIEGDTVKIRPRPYNRNPIVLLLVDRKKGELVDLDLDLEGAVSPDPSNLNTKKRISIEIGPSKLEPYESSSDSKLDEPLPDKPRNPVIVESTRPTISIRKPELLEPITNEPLNNSDLILEGDKIQLDYYKLLAKTSSYILSFVYKARKRVISKDSTPTTYKQVLKLPRDKHSKWLEAITKEFIQLLELGVFKFLPKSLLPSNRKLITCRNVLKVKKDAKNRPIKYKSREEIYMEIPKGLLDLAASNKAIYKLLLKYSYNPSTPNIIKLSKALYRVIYNAKTCHFIVTYIDDCLFIGPNIGYITDLKKRLNKVYAIEDLGPAAYFLGWLSRSLNRPTKSHLNAAKNPLKYLNSTKDYNICFSYNGNTVADLGPKLSNSSNTTTKLSRDFHSKEGPRPLTTTSTTIVDSRNSKGSSQTSIINSSLVPIGFSNSDFTGDKATSKSTYGYLYKLPVAYNPALYAKTKHTLLKFQYVREQLKAKIVTIIYLNTKYIPADGLTKALPVINSTGYFTAL